jgi:integrase
MERVVRKAAQRAGVLRLVSPHWLRHAHASHALDRNAPTRPILRIAHADLDAWLDRHRHDPEVQKAVGQQTMKLEGTRFISTASPEFGEPELDTRRRFRPRERQKA